MKKLKGKIAIGVLIVLVFATAAILVGYTASKAFAAGNGRYELNVYNNYSNFYYRIVAVEDKKVWDETNGVLSATTTYGNSDIAVTVDQVVGGYPIDLPAGLPQGEYDFLWYDSATPAYTDVPKGGFRIQWSGSKLKVLPLDLQ
jgi:hypothetical protein